MNETTPAAVIASQAYSQHLLKLLLSAELITQEEYGKILIISNDYYTEKRKMCLN